jgi:DNA-binding transcriptional MerR regulator
MEYTIKKLADLSGISTRTLRYYDEFGILKPAGTTAAGYRVYGDAQVDMLQQILLYRKLGLGLEMIKKTLSSNEFKRLDALREHCDLLAAEKKKLESLIVNVEKTIAAEEGRLIMSDSEKFEGLKQKTIDENEKKYGKEIREKYGEDQVIRSNEKLKGMTKERYKDAEVLSKELNDALKTAFKSGDPAGEAAQKACELHRKWLMIYWDSYSKEAHMKLVQNYVDDGRFTAYYDKVATGCAVFLRDAMKIYTGIV